MMNFRNRRKQSVEVHTGALNDILFILLLFFLIVSTLANPNVIKLAQPEAESDTKAKQTVVVSINAEQHYFIGQTPVDEQELAAKLRIYIADNTAANPVVVINADKTVPIDNVVRVMRVIKEVGARSVLSVKHP